MLKSLWFLFFVSFSIQAIASPFEALKFSRILERKFVKLDDQTELWVEELVGSSKFPALYFLNGMTQDSEHWNSGKKWIEEYPGTVVFYDGLHQGRTLDHQVHAQQLQWRWAMEPIVEELGPRKGRRLPLLQPVTIERQAQALVQLMDKLGHRQAHLVGLSYGGALALQTAAMVPDQIGQIFLVAPYTEPLASQDQLIRRWISENRNKGPWVRWSEEDLYDFALRTLVLSTYHSSEPSIVKWGPFQIFANSELARGVRHLRSQSLLPRLKNQKIHIVKATLDSYVDSEGLTQLWTQIPSEQKGSFFTIQGVEHKVNESVGPYLMSWISEVLKTPYSWTEGREFVGNPRLGLVTDILDQKEFYVQAAEPCEYFLNVREAHPERLWSRDMIKRPPAQIYLHALLTQYPESLRSFMSRVLRSSGMF